MLFACTLLETQVIGLTKADVPTVTPPRIMQREVIQTPGSMTIGLVINAMSRRWACDPVVSIVS